MKTLGIFFSFVLILTGCTLSQPPDNPDNDDLTYSSSQNSGQTLYSEPTSSQPASLVPTNSESTSSQSASAIPTNLESTSLGSTISAPANSESASAIPHENYDVHEPPRQLIFSSYESFLELYSVLEKSDKEIEEYLVLHSYDMNGLQTRKDIEPLFTKIAATPFPVLEGTKPSRIMIFPDSDVVHITYSLPGDVLYKFSVSMEYAFSSERMKAAHANGLLLNEGNDLLMERGNPIDGVAIYGFIGDENDKKYNRQSFVINVRGTQINVMVFGADEIDASIDDLIRFKYKLNAFVE